MKKELIVVCNRLEDHWGCEGCPHNKPHEVVRWNDDSCSKWEQCDLVDKKVRCTTVKGSHDG